MMTQTMTITISYAKRKEMIYSHQKNTNKFIEYSICVKKGAKKMNLINYNQVMEALEKERQLLLNREQYEAENVLVYHAINVISELRIVRQPEIIR